MIENWKKLVEVKNVFLIFNKGKVNEVRVIDNVSFDIYEGEVFGLVGEFGLGKIIVGCLILKFYDIFDGEIIFNGEVILYLKGKVLYSFCKDV